MDLLCSFLSGLFIAGIIIPITGIALMYYASKGPCRPRVLLSPDGYLVLSFGWCGWLRIPIGSIRSIRVVEELGKGIRLFGASLPGLHIGYYKFSGLGSVRLYSDRRRNHLLIETLEGKKILLGFNAPELARRLRELFGSGPRGRVEAWSRGGFFAGLGLLLALAGAVLVLLAYSHMAPYALFLGSKASRLDLLIIGLLLALPSVIDTVILYGIASDNPVLMLLIPLTGAGMFLADTALALTGILCPAA